MKKGYVYLIRQGETDLYKIGSTSKEPEKRLLELQCGNPERLFLIQVYRTDFPQKIENLMHIALSKNRVRNEWFRFDLSMEDAFTNECSKKENAAKLLFEQDKRNKAWSEWLKKKV
jgi:hypothetical protein